ncbi:MAG: EamA family transporter, partial [Pseudomonadota bacterium]
MFASHSNMALRGSLSVFFSAAVWGVFWIPMRHFDEAGLNAMWGIAAINLAACLIAIPAAIWSRDFKREHVKWLLTIGIGMGFSNVFYFAGLILSDVIRVTFLFYLLPIWATIFSKLLFNVTLGPARLIAIGCAFVGIWLLLGGGGW